MSRILLPQYSYFEIGNVYVRLLRRSLPVFRATPKGTKPRRPGKSHPVDCTVVFVGISYYPRKDVGKPYPIFILSKGLTAIREYPTLPSDYFYFDNMSQINQLFRFDFLNSPCLAYADTYMHQIDERVEVWKLHPSKKQER
jgi:hypothetical protein